MRAPNPNILSNRKRQQGITLVIALVFLLVITVLAISSMREVSLESRITGNVVEYKRLVNETESALRDGERRTVERGPQEPIASAEDCEDIDQPNKDLCLLADDPVYTVDMTNGQPYLPADGTELEGDAKWYAMIAPSGDNLGASENPEYGNMILGIGIFRYEVNGIVTNKAETMKTAIRSTVALNSKGRIQTE